MRIENLDTDEMIIRTASLGVIATNCYVVGCKRTHAGAIIDSVAEPDAIAAMVSQSPALKF